MGTLFAKDGRKGIDATMIGDQSYRINGWASANSSFPLAVRIPIIFNNFLYFIVLNLI